MADYFVIFFGWCDEDVVLESLSLHIYVEW